MQKALFDGMPTFLVPDDLSQLFRPTARKSKDALHVASLAVIADKEKALREFLYCVKARSLTLVSHEEKQRFVLSPEADIEHIVAEWRIARNRGATKIGARRSADKKKAASRAAADKIRDRWPMPSDVWPTRTLLDEAGVSLNTIKAHLGRRSIAQANYQAAQKRKERRNAKAN